MMFEIYTKEVEIKGEKYLLRPLCGRFLPKLYSVLKALNESKNNQEGTEEEKAAKAFDSLNENTISKLHEIGLETFKKSYPEQDEKILDEFVSQNLLILLEALITVNVGNSDEE